MSPDALKPAYLLTGGDAVRIDAERRLIGRRAQAAGATLDVFAGDGCAPGPVAEAISSLSLLGGDRVVVADGVERWRAAEIAPVVAALGRRAPEVTAVLICRKKPLAGIVKAVAAAGGELREYAAPGDSELTAWVSAQAGALGVAIEPAAAARLIVLMRDEGKREVNLQRLVRELEKLTLFVHPEQSITAAAVAAAASGDAAPRVFDLADAVLAGDARSAAAIAEDLFAAGERPGGLLFAVQRTIGQALTAAALIDEGRSGELATELRLPPWLAKKVAGQATAAGRKALERKIVILADLERRTRSGGGVDDRVLFSRALSRLTADGSGVAV